MTQLSERFGVVRPYNPIYQHLTRNRRWPSVGVAVALFLIVALVPTAAISVWLASLLLQTAFVSSDLPIAIVLASLAIALISPWITATMSAISAAVPASDESYSLLKLTGIDPLTIVIGHVWAAVFRLRLLWVVCYGLLPPLAITSLAVGISLDQTFSDGVLPSRDLVSRNISVALIVFVVGLVLGSAINWVALCAGIWAGLRFRRPGQAVAIALGIVVIEFVVVLLLRSLLDFSLYMSEALFWVLSLIVVAALTFFSTKKLLSMAEQSL